MRLLFHFHRITFTDESEFESPLSCTFFSLFNTASVAMRAAVAQPIVVAFFKSGFLTFFSKFFSIRVSEANRIFALFFSSSTFALLADTVVQGKKMESLYSTLATILSTAPANPSALHGVNVAFLFNISFHHIVVSDFFSSKSRLTRFERFQSMGVSTTPSPLVESTRLFGNTVLGNLRIVWKYQKLEVAVSRL